MTLRWIEGFDYLPASPIAQMTAAGWAMSVGSSGAVTVSGGRFGYGRYLSLVNDNVDKTAAYMLGTTIQTAFHGVAMLIPDPGCTPVIAFHDGAGGGTQVSLKFDALGVIRAYRGTPSTGTLLGSSAAGAFHYNTWFYFEAGVHIANVGGTIEARVNTTPKLVLTGQDTQNTANTVFDTLEYLITPFAAPPAFDDAYLCDDAGGTNDDFLGNVRVQTQFAAAPGSSTDWTPSNGALANWECVLNTAIDDSLYVSTPTVGDLDQYEVEAIVNNPVIFGVQVLGFYRQDDATERHIQNVITSGATTDEGPAETIDQTYSGHYAIWETDPDTSLAWTPAAVNSLEIGPKVES